MLSKEDTHTQPSYGIRPQHRLPEKTHVGAVSLQVSDLHRSVEYYSDVLGMAVLDRDDSVARLGVRATGQQLAVLQERRGIAPAPLVARACAQLRQSAPDLIVLTTIEEGIPKEVIVENALAWNADLIVVGSRGHNRLSSGAR